MATTQEKAHHAWRAAERIKRLSDRLVGVGPFGLGLDGILAWVPVAGTVYSVGAGAMLVAAGFRGGASVMTLASTLCTGVTWCGSGRVPRLLQPDLHLLYVPLSVLSSAAWSPTLPSWWCHSTTTW